MQKKGNNLNAVMNGNVAEREIERVCPFFCSLILFVFAFFDRIPVDLFTHAVNASQT